ncbi:MAG: hypothetical protein U9O94_08445 [Nanoarchaeota archaeon]|nr:hypothetical protein [Nanoarchaeota archaeon]
MGKLQLNFGTVIGSTALAVIVFLLLSTITGNFTGFSGIDLGVGIFFVFLILAVGIATVTLKKQFSFTKAEIFPFLIVAALLIVLFVFVVPNLFDGTIFQQSIVSLQSMVGAP